MPNRYQWRVTVTPNTPIDQELADHIEGAFKSGEALWEYAKIGYMVATRKLSGQADADDHQIAGVSDPSHEKFQSTALNFDDED